MIQSTLFVWSNSNPCCYIHQVTQIHSRSSQRQSHLKLVVVSLDLVVKCPPSIIGATFPPGFVEIFLLHQKNASAFAHFQASSCVFLNGSFGNASSRPVVVLSFHVARGSVWLGRGFCCANASRICFSASYSLGGTEAGIQLVAIILTRWMACFTIALIVHTSSDELLHRYCLKKGDEI